MRRTLLYLLGILVAITALVIFFAWVESLVGYAAFAWAGVITLAAFSVIGVLVTFTTIRKKRD